MQVPQLLHFLPFVETRKIWPHTKPIGICQKDVGLSGSQVCFANWLRGLTLSWGKKRRKTGNWIDCWQISVRKRLLYSWGWLCTKASQTFSGTFGTFSGTSLNLTRRLHQCTPELLWAEDPTSLRCWGKSLLRRKVVAGLGTSYNLIEYCSHFVYIFWFSNSVCVKVGVYVSQNSNLHRKNVDWALGLDVAYPIFGQNPQQRYSRVDLKMMRGEKDLPSKAEPLPHKSRSRAVSGKPLGLDPGTKQTRAQNGRFCEPPKHPPAYHLSCGGSCLLGVSDYRLSGSLWSISTGIWAQLEGCHQFLVPDTRAADSLTAGSAGQEIASNTVYNSILRHEVTFLRNCVHFLQTQAFGKSVSCRPG